MKIPAASYTEQYDYWLNIMQIKIMEQVLSIVDFL